MSSGGGVSRTVVVIGYMERDYKFHVVRFERFAASEDPLEVVKSVAKCCGRFQVSWIAADGGGNGHVLNRLFLEQPQTPSAMYAILYSVADQQPFQDGRLWKWTVNRSATIGAMFSRIKKQSLLFPRVTDCGSFLDEFASEIAEYDDINRSIQYTHGPTQQDDALHACNYAVLLAVCGFRGANGI